MLRQFNSKSSLILESSLNNLLIVEDNLFVRKNIFKATKSIKSIGSIKQAESLTEAISLFKNTSFELVVLDLKLPDGNGVELLKMFKENKIETKVLVFSMSTELKKTCLRYGAFAFFDKAKDFDNLIEVIKKPELKN